MISHVYIGITNFQRAFQFYSPIMNELGLKLKFSEEEKSWAAWMSDKPRPLFIIGLPYNGEAATIGNGQMVALLAPTRAAVDRVYGVALKNGGLSEGEPGLRTRYHPNFYGAYFRDLDGNKICVCCHDAPLESP